MIKKINQHLGKR